MSKGERANLPKRPKKVMLIHALTESLEPIHRAFSTNWPEAEIYDLLDSSLSADHAANRGILDTQMMKRFQTLGRYAAQTGSRDRVTHGILFTCSAFGAAIEAVKREIRIPVLTPNEAAFAEALKIGRHIGLLMTFEPSLPALSAEMHAMAGKSGIPLELKTSVIPEALAALRQGRPEIHDTLIAEAASELGKLDVLVLGQFSMARAANAVVSRVSAPVITTPDSAVQELRRLLTDTKEWSINLEQKPERKYGTENRIYRAGRNGEMDVIEYLKERV